ncbi:MAG: GntR family transcriptional regulator [Caldicoprobacterales bacterium]|jgi:GntR family transcriptional regulator|nr:GntR family transcriptional regulator [Clostridiales bacterium]
MLNFDGPTPLYIQIKDSIRKAIASGEWKPNEQIPSERELCKRFNVSRITVRQAIADAENAGLLYKIQGKGTFVKAPKIGQGLTRITSFGKTLQISGLSGSTTILESQVVPVNLQLSSILNCGLEDQVYNLQLLGYGNDEPIVYYNSFFPLAVGYSMNEAAQKYLKLNRPFSTYDLYGELDIAADAVDQTFEAVNCTQEVAKIMKVREGTAMLVVTSVVYTRDSKPVEFKTAMYKADKYKFHLKRNM